MPDTPEWRKAFRDLASIAAGLFLIYRGSVHVPPNEAMMYLGAGLISGPVFLRSLGK